MSASDIGRLTGSGRRQEMAYSDKYGEFFGRLTEDGNIVVLHVADGEAATRLDASVYPIGSELSARYEHPAGIVISPEDAAALSLDVEG